MSKHISKTRNIHAYAYTSGRFGTFQPLSHMFLMAWSISPSKPITAAVGQPCNHCCHRSTSPLPPLPGCLSLAATQSDNLFLAGPHKSPNNLTDMSAPSHMCCQQAGHIIVPDCPAGQRATAPPPTHRRQLCRHTPMRPGRSSCQLDPPRSASWPATTATATSTLATTATVRQSHRL
jgi:hypothetical protein